MYPYPHPHFPHHNNNNDRYKHTKSKDNINKKEKIEIPKNIKDKEKNEGYDEKLKYISTTGEYSTDINNIIKLNDSRYLVSDSNEFHICEIKKDGKDEYIYKSEFKQNLKFGKIIFSSEKVIYIESLDNNQEEKKMFLKIFFNGTYFSCEIKNEVLNILESDNIIILFEEKLIELYKFEQEDLSKPLLKISEIKIDDQILSVEKANTFLFCGHKSGLISIWNAISENPYLKNIRTFKIHYNGINKMICDTKKEKDKIILITCCSDKTLKVHSLENSDRICLYVIYFIDEVVDIKIVKYFDDNKDYYIISLKNGVLKMLDPSFKEIYELPNKLKIQKTRYVL